MRPNEHTVKLHDGREVSNYSEEWRHECECRWLLTAKPTKAAKHLHLYGVVDRKQLFTYDRKNGLPVLRDDYRSLQQGKPLMVFRNLEAADRILADARKIYEASAAS